MAVLFLKRAKCLLKMQNRAVKVGSALYSREVFVCRSPSAKSISGGHFIEWEVTAAFSLTFAATG